MWDLLREIDNLLQTRPSFTWRRPSFLMADISREIERARPALLRYAKKLTRSAEDAEDLVQVTVLAAAKHWSPDGGASFLTYAGNMMPQRRRDVNRKNRVQVVGFADIPVPEGLEFDASDEARCVEEIEASLFANQVLGSVNPSERFVLASQSFGEKLHEIAKEMGVTKQRVFAISRAARLKAERALSHNY